MKTKTVIFLAVALVVLAALITTAYTASKPDRAAPVKTAVAPSAPAEVAVASPLAFPSTLPAPVQMSAIIANARLTNKPPTKEDLMSAVGEMRRQAAVASGRLAEFEAKEAELEKRQAERAKWREARNLERKQRFEERNKRIEVIKAGGGLDPLSLSMTKNYKQEAGQ